MAHTRQSRPDSDLDCLIWAQLSSEYGTNKTVTTIFRLSLSGKSGETPFKPLRSEAVRKLLSSSFSFLYFSRA